MNEFCKIFEDETIGQILVKIDQSEDCKPEIRFYCQPVDLGVCSLALIYTDDDAGWDKAESEYKEMDKEKALRIVSNSPMFKRD